jgi:2-oxoglutarate ferredoxin oxidoreductase subunit gamma
VLLDRMALQPSTPLLKPGALARLGELCERKALEAAVRAETPKSFLDLNLDALAAGCALAAHATGGAPRAAQPSYDRG